MAHTYACLLVHLVFSTRERCPWLHEPDLRANLHAYLGGIARQLETTALAVNGVADHVHLLISFAPRQPLADIVRELKSRSSAWVHRQRPATHAGFAWQAGYSVFSVSKSGQRKVLDYIAGQEEHHREKSFEEELRILLGRHGIVWDERFLLG